MLWETKLYTFFGYNGNYPELLRTALSRRGCWKFLDYQEVCDQQLSRQTNTRRTRANRDRSWTSDAEPPAVQKVNYTAVDEMIIERCSFLWRPCNFYDCVQKKIDKRMLKHGFDEENPLVYNHFEHLKCVGTKSGLVRSLK